MLPSTVVDARFVLLSCSLRKLFIVVVFVFFSFVKAIAVQNDVIEVTLLGAIIREVEESSQPFSCTIFFSML